VRRVTLDTNEYVSALNGGGKALRLLHMAIDGEIEIAISDLSITEDEPDNRILECADEAGSEFIVSEDRDLLRLEQHRNARIIRAVDMLDVVHRKDKGTPEG